MNKYIMAVLISGLSILLTQCNPGKKATSENNKLTYEKNIASVIITNCSPCHIPPKGKMKAYDDYANVRTDINEMIRRVELNPGEKGFMPFKKDVKLSDSTIALLKKWRNDGLNEK